MKLSKLDVDKFKVLKKEIEDQKLPGLEFVNGRTDVLINKPIGGKWKGYLFSQLRDDFDGKKILFWVTKQERFDMEIRKLAQEMLR